MKHIDLAFGAECALEEEVFKDGAETRMECNMCSVPVKIGCAWLGPAAVSSEPLLRASDTKC